MDNQAVIEARLQCLQDTLDNLAYHSVIEGYSELGRVLNVSQPTARRMVESGAIPSVRVGGKVFVQRGDALKLRRPAPARGEWEMHPCKDGYVLTCGTLRAEVKGSRVLLTRGGRPVDIRQGEAVDTPAKFLALLEKHL